MVCTSLWTMTQWTRSIHLLQQESVAPLFPPLDDSRINGPSVRSAAVRKRVTDLVLVPSPTSRYCVINERLSCVASIACALIREPRPSSTAPIPLPSSIFSQYRVILFLETRLLSAADQFTITIEPCPRGGHKRRGGGDLTHRKIEDWEMTDHDIPNQTSQV